MTFQLPRGLRHRRSGTGIPRFPRRLAGADRNERQRNEAINVDGAFPATTPTGWPTRLVPRGNTAAWKRVTGLKERSLGLRLAGGDHLVRPLSLTCWCSGLWSTHCRLSGSQRTVVRPSRKQRSRRSVEQPASEVDTDHRAGVVDHICAAARRIRSSSPADGSPKWTGSQGRTHLRRRRRIAQVRADALRIVGVDECRTLN